MKKCNKPPHSRFDFSESEKRAVRLFNRIFNTRVKKAWVAVFTLTLVVICIGGASIAVRGETRLYKNSVLGFSLKLPQSWDGRLATEDDSECVTFYHKLTREKYSGKGMIFYIERLSGRLTDEQVNESGGRTAALYANGYTYVFGMPTDLQYAPEDKATAGEYKRMCRELEQICLSIRGVNITGETMSGRISGLYRLKNTYAGDNSSVSAIISHIRFAELPDFTTELKTGSRPYKITVNYSVDSRASYRPSDRRNLDKTAAVMFALIPNCGIIELRIFDSKGDVTLPDGAIFKARYERGKIQEIEGMAYFTPENIKSADDSLDTFTEYFNRAAYLAPYSSPDVENARISAIYSVIGPEREVDLKSAASFSVTITKQLADKREVQAMAVSRSIKPEDYIGRQIDFISYDLNNSKSNQGESGIFVFDGGNLLTYQLMKEPFTAKSVLDAAEVYTIE